MLRIFLLPQNIHTVTQSNAADRVLATVAKTVFILPEKVIKVPFKANYFFNSTMMASFLPVTVNSEQKEQTNREKYVFYCSVDSITNSHKS